jgi:hypothetical protein
MPRYDLFFQGKKLTGATVPMMFGSDRDAQWFLIQRAERTGHAVSDYDFKQVEEAAPAARGTLKVVRLKRPSDVSAADVGRVVLVDLEDSTAQLRHFLPRPAGKIVKVDSDKIEVLLDVDPLELARGENARLRAEKAELLAKLAAATDKLEAAARATKTAAPPTPCALKREYERGVKDGRQELADEFRKAEIKLGQLLENPNGVGGSNFSNVLPGVLLSPFFR